MNALRCLLGLLLCLFFPHLAVANITLEAPQTAYQGDAVRVRAFTDLPVASIRFLWQGKTLDAPVMPVGDFWEAEALFPVAMDAAKPHTIQAQAGKDSVQATVTILPVDWPMQHLTVNKSYVDPPQKTLNRIAAERKKSVEVLNRRSPERLWMGTFYRPVPGDVSGEFGSRRVFNGQPRAPHRGLDLRGAQGTPVKALAAGRIALAEPMYFSGNVIYIDHGQGLISMYAHLSVLEVSPGDLVQAGQQIGLVGATGRVTGPHLHLSVSVLGQSVNPLSLFPNRN